jgi:SAM-dependent methyltransferase
VSVDGCGWAKWLENLEEGLGPPERRARDLVVDRVLDRAGLMPGESVLDLGSGLGLLSIGASRLVGSSGRVLALDPSVEALGRLRERCGRIGVENVTTMPGRAEELPFDDEVFNAVVFRSVLAYSEDRAGAARELRRVLVATGRFSGFEPLLGELSWEYGEGLAERFRNADELLAERRTPGTLDRSGLRSAFERAGLDFESLVVRFGLQLEDRAEESVIDEYLNDLPGGLAAGVVLAEEFGGNEALKLGRDFAGAASRGLIKGTLPCLYIWGSRSGRH